ncbi:MAG: DMT family transporter [Gammaproteobacteria bacterium]|nr:DMT family transporter [Gammaproteobacteria bacterium]
MQKKVSTERDRFWKGFILASLGTALFSVKSIFIKLAYAAGSDPESVLLLRMLIAAPFFFVIALWQWRSNVHFRQTAHAGLLMKVMLVGFIGYYLASLLDLKGLALISAQLERMLLFTYPIMVAILGFLFFKQPLSIKMGLALLFSYLGISLIYQQEARFSGAEIALGTLLVLLSALSFSFYVLFSKQLIQKLGSVPFTSVAMLFSTLFMLLHYGLLMEHEVLINNEILLWTVLLAIFSTVVPSFMISSAIGLIGPAQTGIVGTLGPLVTLVLAVTFLGEQFTYFHLAGFCLVVLGVSLLTLRFKKSTTKRNDL